MKVRCIDSRSFLHEEDGGLVHQSRPGEIVSLTAGNVYEVLGVEQGWYRIVDDTGEDYLYPPDLFDVVEGNGDVPGLKPPSPLRG